MLDKDTFKTFGGTLNGPSLFDPAEYRGPPVAHSWSTHGELKAKPVAALLGPIHDFSGKPIGAVELVMDNPATFPPFSGRS